MIEWNIQGRARACQGCGRGFADRETYHTLLFEERSGFQRLDVCGACWETQHRHGGTDRKGFVSYWQGVYLVPPPPPPEPIQKDSAESLLRRLTEQMDPARHAAAFILAVMLERKRVLKVRETRRQEGRRVLIYELPRTGEIFTIPDPELHLDQLEQVQREVATLLEQGLPGPTNAAADGAPAPGTETAPTEEPFVPAAAPVTADTPVASSASPAPAPEADPESANSP